MNPKDIDSSKIRLLLIDDDKAIQRNLVLFLEDEGMQVTAALSGEEGIDILKSHVFDVAIVDMRLPGMDGNEFIFKAYSFWPEMKYVIHTGSVDYVLSRQMEKIGLKKEDIFLKPVEDMSQLYLRILEILTKD